MKKLQSNWNKNCNVKNFIYSKIYYESLIKKIRLWDTLSWITITVLVNPFKEELQEELLKLILEGLHCTQLLKISHGRNVHYAIQS